MAITAMAVGGTAVPRVALAGGGPENVFVVVNPRSWASMTVANSFCRLRRIPAGNVYHLDWSGSFLSTDVETFRQKILGPVLREIQTRGLSYQIDYIIYSSDFPYRIRINTADLTFPQDKPAASITGLTYLSELVMSPHGRFTQWGNNLYMRPYRDGRFTAPTHGFRSRYLWASDGRLVRQSGMRYRLSTMLAFTSGRGTSASEAVRYLRRSASADGVHPRGTIYYVKNSDVRSTTRDPLFADAVAELKRLGIAAEIVPGKTPVGKKDVQGAMMGCTSFNWRGSHSLIRPGAICENLTSFGGVLDETSHHTPLTELLRYGAAGSSGTVIEPYAIQNKFPLPMIHVHYGRGCSLAEAFYQSVYGPFQLLIVGDPLCRPWATIPTVFAGGLEPGQVVKGKLKIAPRAEIAEGWKIGGFELFLDGRVFAKLKPGESRELDTELLPDGYHELRVVAVEDSPIESQGRLIVPFTVQNRGRTIRCETLPQGRASWDRPLRFAADSPGSRSIVVYHNRRVLGTIAGQRGELQIDTKRLGLGPVALQAVGMGGGEKLDNVFARPVRLDIMPPAPLPGAPVAAGSTRSDGVLLQRADGARTSIPTTGSATWMEDAGIGIGQTFDLSGYFRVDRTEVYQLQIQLAGNLDISVDGVTIGRGQSSEFQLHYIPVPLGAGWHELRLRAKPSRRQMSIFFGGKGTYSLDGKRFKH